LGVEPFAAAMAVFCLGHAAQKDAHQCRDIAANRVQAAVFALRASGKLNEAQKVGSAPASGLRVDSHSEHEDRHLDPA